MAFDPELIKKAELCIAVARLIQPSVLVEEIEKLAVELMSYPTEHLHCVRADLSAK